MARARNIKPGFFKNPELVELPFATRLLYIGLWTLADRDGYLEDRPKRIRMEIFPADDVDVEQGLSDLAKHGFIYRYTVDGNGYLHISKFLEHQHPHHAEKPSSIPRPGVSLGLFDSPAKPKPGVTLVSPQANPSDSLIPDSLNPDKGANASRKRRMQLPDDFKPNESSVESAKEKKLDLNAELEKFRNYHQAKGSVMLDWQAAFRTWLGNAVTFSKAGKASGGEAWRSNDNLMLDKARELGVSSHGKTVRDLLAAIDAKLRTEARV